MPPGDYDPKFVRYANQFAYEAVSIFEANPGRNKEALLALGELVYAVTYEGTDNDLVALGRLHSVIDAADSVYGDAFRDLLTHDQASRTLLMSAGRWADQAFPQIVVGHKYAAALAATVVRDPHVIAHIMPPFKAFLIDVPPGLFPIAAYDAEMQPLPGEFNSIIRILVRYGQIRIPDPSEIAWNLSIFTDGYVNLWRIQDTAQLISEEVRQLGSNDERDVLPVGDVDSRSMLLAARLVLNVCLAFSDPDNVKPMGRAKTSAGRPKGSRIEPKLRVFQLGKPISVDVRQEIQDFAMHGSSRAPSVQSLVRGHWKPLLGARLGRPVWIEPYWRGPEDAPILVRPKTFKEL